MIKQAVEVSGKGSKELAERLLAIVASELPVYVDGGQAIFPVYESDGKGEPVGWRILILEGE